MQILCLVYSIVRNGHGTLHSNCLLSLGIFPVMVYFQESSTQDLCN